MTPQVTNPEATLDLPRLLMRLSLLTDLARDVPFETALLASHLALDLADAARLTARDRRCVFYASLLRYLGCTAYSTELTAAFGLDERSLHAHFAAVDASDLVNLNLRLGDSELVASLVRGGSGARLAGRAFDMLDLLLDSKTQALVRTLAEVDGVEVMTATLNLGRMSFITRKNLPHTIRSGQIMEAWKLELYRGSGAYA